MKQYFDIKAEHPDAILLFRVGDFYEMYGEDAVTGDGRFPSPSIRQLSAQTGACR